MEHPSELQTLIKAIWFFINRGSEDIHYSLDFWAVIKQSTVAPIVDILGSCNMSIHPMTKVTGVLDM